MKRQGKVFEILGKAARSENFSIESDKLPDVTRKAYAAGRNALNVARLMQKDLKVELAKLAGDEDLTDDARYRKIREVRESTQSVVAGARESFQKTFEETHAAITKRIRTAQRGADPLALPRIDWGKLSMSDTEVAKLHRASAEQTANLVRSLARQQVDAALDRALDDTTGVALTAAYARALDSNDLVLLEQWENYGRNRVEREGRQAQKAVLAEQIDSAQEARLGDDELVLLDHIDVLVGICTLVDAVANEAAFDSFGDRCIPLETAPQLLGDELAGLEA